MWGKRPKVAEQRLVALQVKDIMAHLYFKAKETFAQQQPPEVRCAALRCAAGKCAAPALAVCLRALAAGLEQPDLAKAGASHSTTV